jgi:hypothetical protein
MGVSTISHVPFLKWRVALPLGVLGGLMKSICRFETSRCEMLNLELAIWSPVLNKQPLSECKNIR